MKKTQILTLCYHGPIRAYYHVTDSIKLGTIASQARGSGFESFSRLVTITFSFDLLLLLFLMRQHCSAVYVGMVVVVCILQYNGNQH